MKRVIKPKARTLLLGLMPLVCAMVAMQVLAEEDSSRPQPFAETWQHLALTSVIGETPKSELAANINKLGREGWELVSVDGIQESGTTKKTVFYFKKPL